MRAEPALQPEVRNGAVGARDRRLADTITGYDPQSPNPAANGFVFQEYSSLALSECLRQACDAYQPARRLAATGRHGHAAGLVVGPRARRNTWSCIERRWSKGRRRCKLQIEKCELKSCSDDFQSLAFSSRG